LIVTPLQRDASGIGIIIDSIGNNDAVKNRAEASGRFIRIGYGQC
jgi:hypothetical protein